MKKKPEWAEHWAEEEFDYGLGMGYCAQVGPVREAVRYHKKKCLKAAVYGEFKEVEEEHWCEECETHHPHKVMRREVLEPAVWVDQEIPMRDEAIAFLKDWFVRKVVEMEEFIAAADRLGLRPDAPGNQEAHLLVPESVPEERK